MNKPGTIVICTSTCVALLLAVAALALPSTPPLRLHPGLFPLLLAGLICVSAGVSLRQLHRETGEAATGLRAVVATAAAMVALALLTRAGGVLLATLASATIASAGVSGVSWRRAALVGLGLAIAVSTCLWLIPRQPLPLLPPGLFS